MTIDELCALSRAKLRGVDAAWLCGMSLDAAKRIVRRPAHLLIAIHKASIDNPSRSAADVLSIVKEEHPSVTHDVVYNTRRALGLRGSTRPRK